MRHEQARKHFHDSHKQLGLGCLELSLNFNTFPLNRCRSGISGRGELVKKFCCKFAMHQLFVLGLKALFCPGADLGG